MKWSGIKKIFIGIALAIADLTIYLFLSFALMEYDDTYDTSKGDYWSMQSMTVNQKLFYIGFITWHALNILAVMYFVYRIIKWFRN